VFVRAAEFWSAYLLSSFAIKKEEREREMEREREKFFLWIKLLCAVLCNFSLSPLSVFLGFGFQKKSTTRQNSSSSS